MQLQSTPHGCGPAAIVNALEALGKYTTQDAVARLARTDAEGTDERGAKRALRLLGFVPQDLVTASRAAAWYQVCGALLMGYPCLLAVDNDSHWITAIGLLGGLVLVLDSADGGLVQSLDQRSLLARWGSRPTRKIPSIFYAIAIHPR